MGGLDPVARTGRFGDTQRGSSTFWHAPGFGGGCAGTCRPRLAPAHRRRRAGEVVHFSISDIDEDETYVLEIGDRRLAEGSGTDAEEVSGQFTMPDLGGGERTVTVEAEIGERGDTTTVKRKLRYLGALAPAPAIAGPSPAPPAPVPAAPTPTAVTPEPTQASTAPDPPASRATADRTRSKRARRQARKRRTTERRRVESRRNTSAVKRPKKRKETAKPKRARTRAHCTALRRRPGILACLGCARPLDRILGPERNRPAHGHAHARGHRRRILRTGRGRARADAAWPGSARARRHGALAPAYRASAAPGDRASAAQLGSPA